MSTNWYLYTIKTLVPTYMADGSNGPLAVMLHVIGGPEGERLYWWTKEFLPESVHVGTLQDIKREVELANPERLIVLGPVEDDTALVNMFSGLDVLVVLPRASEDFHAIQKAHVTLAVFIESDLDFHCIGDLRSKDFIMIYDFDEGSDLHMELMKRFEGRVWVHDGYFGWGGEVE